MAAMKNDSASGIISAYNYILPPELIAQKPVSPREAARLLVYNRKTGKIFHDEFFNIGKYLPPNSLVVFNDTKVIPARLRARKQTGGRVEIFFLAKDGNKIQAFVSPRVKINSRVYLSKKIFFEVISQQEKVFILKPNFKLNQLDAILEKYGSTPLPPYIKNSPLTEKQARHEYQTVFAKTRGSVAAPTASLHFSKKLLGSLKKQGHQITFVTLHVNLGTFAPLTRDQVLTNKLHEEWFYIPDKTRKIINNAQKHKKTVIACGTTVVRTLESGLNRQESDRKWQKTDLFIRPGYKFKVVNGMITNFHLPGSSLLMLVAGFTGKTRLRKLYKQAISQKYRFYSFGDGMLIL